MSKGTASFENLNLSYIQQKFLLKLKQNSGVRKDIINHTITIDKMKQGYKKWKEETSTSPSGWHLGHVKVLLIPDSNSYDDEHIDYADDIWDIYTTIMNFDIILE